MRLNYTFRSKPPLPVWISDQPLLPVPIVQFNPISLGLTLQYCPAVSRSLQFLHLD